MSSAYHLRQTYLAKANQSLSLSKGPLNAEENYEQTLKHSTDIIATIKEYLYKIKKLKELIEENKNSETPDDLKLYIKQLRQYQDSIQFSCFSKPTKLNQKQHFTLIRMTGPFTFRLTKEINYWRFALPFTIQIVRDIESSFQEQKMTQKFSLFAITMGTLKGLKSKVTEMIKSFSDHLQLNNILRNRKSRTLPLLQKVQKSYTQEKKQTIQIISPQLQRVKQIEKEKSRTVNQKAQMLDEMFVNINKIYKGLEIKSLEPISYYYTDLSKDENMILQFKEQKRRNKNMKKYIKGYAHSYKDYKTRKAILQKKKQRGSSYLKRSREVSKSTVGKSPLMFVKFQVSASVEKKQGSIIRSKLKSNSRSRVQRLSLTNQNTQLNNDRKAKTKTGPAVKTLKIKYQKNASAKKPLKIIR